MGSVRARCGLLARTDDSVPRRRGISMLIVDMASPGVEVRPMTQITGHAEFSQLFLDDVVVPKENLLGRARRRVEDRHVHAGTRAGNRRAPAAGQVADLARSGGVDGRSPQARRESGARQSAGAGRAVPRLVAVEVLRYHAYRTVGEFLSGGAVGPDCSSVKLLMAEAEQQLAATVLDVLGPTLLRGDPDDVTENDFWYETYLCSRAASVYGGTRQIQRDIVADRILSLPEE